MIRLFSTRYTYIVPSAWLLYFRKGVVYNLQLFPIIVQSRALPDCPLWIRCVSAVLLIFRFGFSKLSDVLGLFVTFELRSCNLVLVARRIPVSFPLSCLSLLVLFADICNILYIVIVIVIACLLY